MGLFKSSEEKELERQQKDTEKLENFLKYYGLEDLNNDDKDNLLNLAKASDGDAFFHLGTMLSASETDYLSHMDHQNSVIIDQNFLIIKQLDRLNKNLEKLLEK